VQEPGVGQFTSGSLDYTLALAGPGNLSTVHHTLLQKSNGTFYLMLWQEVGGFNRPSQTIINNPPLDVTLSLTTPIRRANVYLTNQSLTPIFTRQNPTAISLSVPDEMLVVELIPPIPEPAFFTMVSPALLAMFIPHRPRRPSGFGRATRRSSLVAGS
jgi:hypothetical protein